MKLSDREKSLGQTLKQTISQETEQASRKSTSQFHSLSTFRNIRKVFKGLQFAKIPPKSFARLKAADNSQMPSPRIFVARDGFTLAYRYYEAQTDWITVVLHGAAGHSGHMHSLASQIADRGASQVYCLDLRGHGLSGRRLGFEVSYFDQMVDDVAEFITSLHAAKRGARIIIVGYSAGGGLAIRVAHSLSPGHIAAFVLLAPFLGLDSPTTRPGLGGWARPDIVKIPVLAALSRLGIRQFNNTEVVEFGLPESARDGLDALKWSFNTMMAFGPNDWRAELLAIEQSQPTLLITAEADECFISENYPVLVQSLVPHAVTKTVRYCGHWDLLVARQTAEETIAWMSTFTHH